MITVQSKVYRVYSLVDVTNRPFYIGVTSKDLSKRLSEHIGIAKNQKRKFSVKNLIIRKSRFQIGIKMIDEISITGKSRSDMNRAALEIESFYIKKYKKRSDCLITNLSILKKEFI